MMAVRKVVQIGPSNLQITILLYSLSSNQLCILRRETVLGNCILQLTHMHINSITSCKNDCIRAHNDAGMDLGPSEN